MGLDEELLCKARAARDRAFTLQQDAHLARRSYWSAIRHLHAGGGAMDEIAHALGLSPQRVGEILAIQGGGRPGRGERPGRSSELSLLCSLCGTSDGGRLIAGPGVYICDRCVGLAVDAIADGCEPSNEETIVAAVEADSHGDGCSFCEKRRDAVVAMACSSRSPGGRGARGDAGASGAPEARGDAGVRICSECLDLCKEILAEGGGIEASW